MHALLTVLARLGVALALLATLGASVVVIRERAQATRAAATPAFRPVPVETATMTRSESFETIDHFVGRIEPARRAGLAFERAGLVTQVLVDEGDRVAAGETLARLDAALLAAERARLEGERTRTRAELELARLTETRQRRLRDEGHVSDQRLDEARLAAEALAGTLTAIDAAVERVDIDLAKTRLVAPYAGRIGARHTDPGAVVAPGTAVLELLETVRPQARVAVTPAAARALSPGERVTLLVEGRERAGVVAAVRPDVAAATRTIAVLVDVEDATGLEFGDVVRLAHRRRIEETGFWLPSVALSEGVRGLWSVLTIAPGDDGAWIVGREAVEVLHTEAERVYVRGTLRPGQRAILSGAERVVPGQRVVPASGPDDAPVDPAPLAQRGTVR